MGSVDLDPDSAAWVKTLGGAGREHDEALARLHELLVRIARSELLRRSGRHHITGPELEDVAHQAAADALLAITDRIDQFRGESRFTTWAFKFVVFEVSAKLSRHIWRTSNVSLDAEDWDALPGRFGLEPEQEAEGRDLLAGVRTAVTEELTAHQRMLFVAIVLNGVPLDALVEELGSNRNAIYKALFDARRKLRANLVANGYLDNDPARRR